MNPKELFPKKVITLGDGNPYNIEFTFRSLLELQDLNDGDVQGVFKMYEGDLNPSHLLHSLWASLLTHHPEFEIPRDEIKRKMSPLIDPESVIPLKFALTEVFASFWNRAKESKKLDPEYQAVLDEFESQQKKAKKKK
jgi:hypothetical protein